MESNSLHTRWILRNRAVALTGPPIAELVDEVPAEQVEGLESQFQMPDVGMLKLFDAGGVRPLRDVMVNARGEQPLRLAAMFLTRGEVIDEDRVLALAGEDVQRYAAAGATIVLGETGSVIIAEPGDSLTLSCVWNDSEFRLLRRPESPLPAVLLARARGSLPIHLVVRLAAGPTYVGPVRHSMSESSNGELEFCRLRFASPVSPELLDQVRPEGAVPEVAGVEWLTQVAVDRGAALESFITGWHGEADPGAGAPPQLPPRVPPALARLYRLAHGRPQKHGEPVVLGLQNFILPVDDLYTDQSDGSLVFGTENQGGFTWTLDQYADDPTVWTVGDDEAVAELEPLSGFLIQFSLFEAAICAPYTGLLRNQPEEVVSRLTSRWAEVPLKPAHWYGSAIQFYVAPGLIAQVSPDWGDGYEICLGAGHRGVLRPLRELGLAWKSFDG